MKYIITENQLDRFISKWLSKEYTDLEIYDHDNQPWCLYVNKDGEVIFLYHTKDNELYVSKDVMKFLIDMFSIDVEQTKDILREWFEKYTGLNSYRVYSWDFFDADWKEIVRWETKKRLS